VGRSSACLYPAAATNLPSVGAYSAPSIERIVALAPTHVLMTYLSDPSMSNRLERLGIRVLQFPCERLADYAPMRARLAALCGMSETNFRREWTAAYGQTPLAYRDGLRIAHAKELLLHAGATVGEAALACGFEDESYFVRFFKKQTGVTPGAYRKRFVTL
jgi:AraC-like DNA-binding protein